MHEIADRGEVDPAAVINSVNPPSAPHEGSCGVVRHLCSRTAPALPSTRTKSVKVPDVETNPIAERSWRAGKRKCVGHGRPGSEACARLLAWRTEDAISLGGVGTRPSTMLAAPVQAEAIIGLNGRSCRRYG